MSSQRPADADVRLAIRILASSSIEDHVATVLIRMKHSDNISNVDEHLSAQQTAINNAYMILTATKNASKEEEKKILASKLTQVLEKQITALYICLRKWGVEFNDGQQPSKHKCAAIAHHYYEHEDIGVGKAIEYPFSYEKLEEAEYYEAFLAKVQGVNCWNAWVEGQKKRAWNAWVECAGVEGIRNILDLE